MVKTVKPPKIPKQLYVVAKDEDISYWDHTVDKYIRLKAEFPLGFLHEFGTGAGFEKRQRTQLSWAYDYSYGPIPEVQLSTESIYVGGEERWTRVTKPASYQPTVWDNEPLTGFRILKAVSRMSTSNKLWRILDPRGVQFEISTASLEDLLEQTTITKNLIIGECVWASNKNLKFVGENDPV